MKEKIQQIIRRSASIKDTMAEDEKLASTIDDIVNTCIEAIRNGNSIYWCGNGGSAADSQHLAAELSGRFYFDRDPLPSDALHCNTSYLTAVANDYHYDVIYSRLIKGLGKSGDVLIGLSTSGKSNNVVNAFNSARDLDMKTIGFTGEESNKFKYACDIVLNIPSNDTPRIQEGHMLAGHIICQLIEEILFS